MALVVMNSIHPFDSGPGIQINKRRSLNDTGTEIEETLETEPWVRKFENLWSRLTEILILF